MTMFGTRTGTCGTLWSPVRPSFVTRTVSAEPGEGQRPGAPPPMEESPFTPSGFGTDTHHGLEGDKYFAGHPS